MSDLDLLRNLELAPYILKAMALINVSRKVGGNQFRHSFATLGILLDYKYIHDSALLKAALLHDFLEDLPDITVDEIRQIDFESYRVVELVLEVTRLAHETKPEYLRRVRDHGSHSAKVLKCADRISNLTDLHRDTHTEQKITMYLDETEMYVLPMAREVNKHMCYELTDLIEKRREIVKAKEQSLGYRFKELLGLNNNNL